MILQFTLVTTSQDWQDAWIMVKTTWPLRTADLSGTRTWQESCLMELQEVLNSNVTQFIIFLACGILES